MHFPILKQLSRFTGRLGARRLSRPSNACRQLSLEQLEDRVVPSIVFGSAGARQVAYSGGNVVYYTDVDLVFWGNGWNSNNGPTLRTHLMNAVGTIMNSPYLSGGTRGDGLTQYGGISNGHFLSSQTITSSSPPNPFTDLQVDQFLQANITAGVLSDFRTDSNIVYIVIPQPGTVNIDPTFGGAHYSDRLGFLGPRFHYGWTINRNNENIDFLTSVVSHEIVETATDPESNFPNGTAWWVPSTNDEISDGDAEHYSYRLNNVLVQSFLSQNRHAYIVPTGQAQDFWVSSGGVLTVNGDQLANHDDTITVGVQGGGVHIALNGEVAQFEPGVISSIVVNTETGNDSVTIGETPVGVPVTVNLGTGHDTVTVGAPSLNNQARVTVYGQPGGQATLVVDDHGTPTSETYTITNSSVSRTSGGVGSIFYNNIQNLVVDVGTANETVTTGQTPVGVPVTVNLGAGHDTVIVGAPSLNNQAPVTVNGKPGGQAMLVVDDRGTLTSEIYTVTSSSVSRTSGGVGSIFYNNIQKLVLDTGTASSLLQHPVIVDIAGTAAGTETDINAQPGVWPNIFTVGDAANTLNGIQGPLSLTGANFSQLAVYDQGTSIGRTYTVRGASIDRSGSARISFQGMLTVGLNGASGGAVFQVANVPNSAMILNGTGGTNTLIGPDQANSWTLNAAHGGVLDSNITFNGFQNLWGGRTGGDTFILSSAVPLSMNLALNSAGTLNTPSGSQLLSGAINNYGHLLTVSGAGNTTLAGLISGAGGLSKQGGGTLTLSAANSYSGNTTIVSGTVIVNHDAALGTAGTSTTVLPGGTLALSGGLTYATAENLLLAGPGFQGAGALENLDSSNTFAGAITLQAPSTMTASAGAFLLTGTLAANGNLLTVNGPGSLTLAGGSTFLANGGLVDNGTLIVSDGTTLELAGSGSGSGNLNVAGTLQLDAGAAFTFSGTYSQMGTLIVADGATLALLGGSFTNYDGASLSGGTYDLLGTFQFTGANIVANLATIVLDGPDAQILDELSNNALAGLVANVTGARLTLQNGANLTTLYDLENEGTLTIGSGSTLTNAGTLTNTGELSGSGTIAGDVVNGGTIDPGGVGAGGVLTINGNFTQTASGVLNIEIGDVSAGSNYDRLLIGGTATLDGTLNVTLIGGFTPVSGDTYQILTFASASGTFAIQNIDASFLALVYDPMDLTIQAA